MTSDNPLSLRPYQVRAIEELRAAVARGVRRVLLVAPTGAGKTTIASAIIIDAVAAGQRALFLAHRRELIHQTYRKLLELGVPEQDVGILMASDRRRRPAARVQVASIDTLRFRAKPPADIVFIDEAHRSQAASYRNVVGLYPEALHIGLTATPYRADGRGLRDCYDELLLVASVQQLVREGFLVEPRVFTVPLSLLPDLSRLRVRGGDYDERALADAVDQQQLVGNIVEHWQRLADGVRTVVFAASIAHSRHIVDRFRSVGVAAEHLDGTMPSELRDAVLRRLEQGETRVVCNVAVLSEGWDQPSVKCAVLARPTKSTGLYLQQAGRILRPWQGQPAILLDHAGCAVEHGLPQDDRVFSLDGEKTDRSKGKSKARVPRVCPTCFLVVAPTVRVCPACTAELVTTVPLPEETPEQLVEAKVGQFVPPAPSPKRASASSERAALDFLRQAARRGGRVSWDEIEAHLAQAAR